MEEWEQRLQNSKLLATLGAFEKQEAIDGAEWSAYLESKSLFLDRFYQEFSDAQEDLCAPRHQERVFLFPSRKAYAKVDQLRNQMENHLWNSSRISYANDVNDFARCTSSQKRLIEHIHAFFTVGDQLINTNIQENLLSRVTVPEILNFLQIQIGQEATHNLSYNKAFDAILPRSDDKYQVYQRLQENEAIKLKSNWLSSVTESPSSSVEVPLPVILIAAACTELVSFQSLFVVVEFFKKQGMFPGLGELNEYIRFDETIHGKADLAMYQCCTQKLPTFFIHWMLREAVTIEKCFLRSAFTEGEIPGLPLVHLLELNEWVADSICRQLNLPVIYDARNHFAEVDLIQLPLKTDFFAARGHNYMLFTAESASPSTEGQQGDAQNGTETGKGIHYKFDPLDAKKRRQLRAPRLLDDSVCGH